MVVLDDTGFTTTSTAASAVGMVGILLADTTDGSDGYVQFISPQTASAIPAGITGASADDYLFTSSTPGEATADATRAAGAFGRILAVDGSGVPTLVELWGVPDGSGAGGGGITLGSLTPDGTPGTAISDANHQSFPGLVRLTGSTVLLVNRKGTSHLAGGDYYGQIGTLTTDGSDISSWGSQFLIYSHATLDVRGEDMASIVDDRVVLAGRHYDGTDNQSPFVLVSDVAVADITSSTTWTKHDVTLTRGTKQNYVNGRVVKLQDGTYLLGWGAQDTSANHEVGVFLNSSLTDWSSPTEVVVGAVGSNDYAEIAVEEFPDGTLRASVRSVTDGSIYDATSSDHGATWTTIASAFDGYGFPMMRRLTSGLTLTVYRDAPDGDTAWRSSSDDGATWGSETILDTTGTRNVYATALQLTPTAILCAYAVEGTGGSSATDADIYTQVFTDSSTGFTYHDQLAGVLPNQHHSQIHQIDGGDHWTAETDTTLALKPDGSGGLVFGSVGSAPAEGDNHYEVVVAGSSPPVAVTTEDGTDWIYGWVTS